MSLDEIDELMREAKERERRMTEQEDHYAKEITKYFDRIHEKLFGLNNIYIAAYLALIAFKHGIPKVIILVPFINMIMLIYVELRMMKTARMFSNYSQLTGEQRDILGKRVSNTNLYSLFLITTTIAVGVFIFKYVG